MSLHRRLRLLERAAAPALLRAASRRGARAAWGCGTSVDPERNALLAEYEVLIDDACRCSPHLADAYNDPNGFVQRVDECTLLRVTSLLERMARTQAQPAQPLGPP